MVVLHRDHVHILIYFSFPHLNINESSIQKLNIWYRYKKKLARERFRLMEKSPNALRES